MTKLGSEILETIKDTGAVLNMAYKLWFMAVTLFSILTIVISFVRKKIQPDERMMHSRVNFFSLVFGIGLVLIGLIIYLLTAKAISNGVTDLSTKTFVMVLRLLRMFGTVISAIGASFVHDRYIAETNILWNEWDRKRALRRKKKKHEADKEEHHNG